MEREQHIDREAAGIPPFDDQTIDDTIFSDIFPETAPTTPSAVVQVQQPSSDTSPVTPATTRKRRKPVQTATTKPKKTNKTVTTNHEDANQTTTNHENANQTITKPKKTNRAATINREGARQTDITQTKKTSKKTSTTKSQDAHQTAPIKQKGTSPKQKSTSQAGTIGQKSGTSKDETTAAAQPPADNTETPDYHATVHDIPIDDRPRERLLHHGPDMLATAELLAIILRTGTQRDNVIELATGLLAKYGGLSGLMGADFHDLCATHGLGPAKTAQVKAALELGKRLSMLPAEKRYQITSADDAARLIRMEMMYLDHEEMHILLLDTRNQVIECIKRYKGTVNSSVLRIAEVLRPAITRNSPRLIVCHNHPSGDPTPSTEDIEVTKQLVQAARLLDIELLDHLIIGNPHYLSLKERLNW